MTRARARLDVRVLIAGRRCTYLDVRGDLDLGTSRVLCETLRRAAARSDRVVVDLRDAAFLDPHGLSVLHRAVRRGGPRLSVLLPQGGAGRRMLEVLRVDVLGERSLAA